MSQKILIIEGSPTACGIIKDILEMEGYEVFVAENGEDGVKRAEQEKPDLVIADTLLPGIDGFEVCRQIREIQGSTTPKIIIITGSVDAVDAVKARKAGADDYCVKTNNFSHLIKAVEELV